MERKLDISRADNYRLTCDGDGDCITGAGVYGVNRHTSVVATVGILRPEDEQSRVRRCSAEILIWVVGCADYRATACAFDSHPVEVCECGDGVHCACQGDGRASVPLDRLARYGQGGAVWRSFRSFQDGFTEGSNYRIIFYLFHRLNEIWATRRLT